MALTHQDDVVVQAVNTHGSDPDVERITAHQHHHPGPGRTIPVVEGVVHSSTVEEGVVGVGGDEVEGDAEGGGVSSLEDGGVDQGPAAPHYTPGVE